MGETGDVLGAVWSLVADAIVVVRDGVVEDVNPACERLFGRTRDTMVGMSVDVLRQVDGVFARATRSDGVELVLRVERRDAGDRVVEVLRAETAEGAQLTELHDRLRVISDLATDYHYAADYAPDGLLHIRWLSPSFERVTGYTLDDVHANGQGLQFIVRDDLPALIAKGRANSAGERSVAEYRMRTKQGELRWIRDVSAPVFDEQRRVVGVVGAASDVTAEKQAEMRLRDSESRYRLLADQSQDMISRLAPDGTCLYISPSVRQVLGYEPEELVGRVNQSMIHPEERDARENGLSQLAVTRRSASNPMITRVRRKDGRYVFLEAMTRAIRDEKGALLEVHAAMRDVTARLEAEQAVARAETAFRELLEGMPEPLVLHADGLFVHVNANFLELTGYVREELVGRRIIDVVHPEDREYVQSRVREPGHRPRARAHRLLHRDGSSIDVEVSSVPALFEGRVAQLSLLHDMREQTRLKTELALADRLASLGRLASAVGHEINNPLTYVLATLELLDNEVATLRDPLAETLAARVSVVREGAERVRDIVRDLRALSSAEAPLGPVDLARVLEVASATAAHEIRHRARLVREPFDVPPVLGAHGRLVQVFVNLLVNAAQAIPDGDVDGNEIRVVVRREGESVTIEVRDTGAGFSAADAQRIFEPFFTTKAVGGTGLGLAIVQRIVSSMGGSVAAEPREPRGALFRVTLPIAEAELEGASADSSPSVQRAKSRVLIADDEPLIGTLVASLLRPHDVVAVGSGRDVISLLSRGESFDAILCDLQMTDASGADVYDWVVASRPELEARLAFMTGGAFTERARHFLETSQRPFLEKPFDVQRLKEFVAALIARAPA